MSHKHFTRALALLLSLVILSNYSCNQQDEIAVNEMLPRLSDYAIFNGNASDLVPNADYKLYELASTLFTDYAEKQRLIKVPAGKTIKAVNDGLPDFPDGTVIVKTFYYFHDKRDISKGKNIIETRLLIKKDNHWKVGVFKWNREQTDAILFTSGDYQSVNWIGLDGKANVISYRFPSNADCRTCHQSDDDVVPIGPKIRNLNINVARNGVSVNQLTHLADEGVLNRVKPTWFSVLPDYHNTSLSVEHRARAYLEVNCAHCHSDGGFAGNRRPRFGYEYSLQSSNILAEKATMVQRMGNGQMPKLGNTVLDKEGTDLVIKYLNSL
ncbi:c-type cytochrome [Dyadobacter sp. CY261]|uniref:c-type cytochrome n=1 Tax=Dyadobacter sp. CY261 TaxID=2907203 RepID=UPI001F20BBD9|nr:c-type cytochrome [Dyadobacter sp. CY261]MCF0075305.1 c-type cytochrome [Dyadobacter sp. CY261]